MHIMHAHKLGGGEKNIFGHKWSGRAAYPKKKFWWAENSCIFIEIFAILKTARVKSS